MLKPTLGLEYLFLQHKKLKSMKQFLKTNWYKVMISISVFIFSVGFFINSITPAFARSSFDLNKTSFKKNTSGEDMREEDYEVVVSGGYAYLVWSNGTYISVTKKVQLK